MNLQVLLSVLKSPPGKPTNNLLCKEMEDEKWIINNNISPVSGQADCIGY